MPRDAACSLPRAQRPCAECPWRVDVEPGQFPAHRYDALQGTVGAAGLEAPIGAPMFACHVSTEGRERACAGWLAVAGRDHLGVRVVVAVGRIPAGALDPGAGWPELHRDYGEMVAAKAEPDTSPPDGSIHWST